MRDSWTEERRQKQRERMLGNTFSKKPVQSTQVVMNHKIVSIESVGVQDVYCMSVDKYENFAIDVDGGKDCSSGVFVHNCMDFRFRWGWYDAEKKVLSGPKKNFAYTRKTPPPPLGHPSVNPKELPGYCKHIHTLLQLLQRRKILV